MTRALIASLLALALCACGTHRSTTAAAGDASKPRAIAALTDQTQVYECPKCGMDFDQAGACSMDGTALVAMKVAYICPADEKPVDHSGACPRCPANARVEKTAMAVSGN